MIDLSPEGGDGGGEIVAAGTPEDVVKVKRSYTGQFLEPVLRRKGTGKKRRIDGGVTMRAPVRGSCLVAAIILVLATINQAAAQSAASRTRAFYEGKSHMFFDSGHGTQVEYMGSNGTAYLWYPGNKVVVPGHWKIKKGGTVICFRYGTDTYNPVTRLRGGDWECQRTKRHMGQVVDSVEGDPFGLSQGPPPFVLARDQTTFDDLRRKLQR